MLRTIGDSVQNAVAGQAHLEENEGGRILMPYSLIEISD
jgi:hypothetical protein